MTCFWQRFVSANDVDCDVDPTTHIYAHPINLHEDSVFSFFSDAALTVQIFPTSATITSISVYAGATDIANCNCPWIDWWAAPTDSESPPRGAQLGSPYTVSMGLDLVSPLSFAPILTAAEYVDLGGGYSYSWRSIPANTIYNTVIILTVQTDVGMCLLVFAGSCCY